MKPEFNEWYVILHEDVKFDDGSTGNYREFDIFWPVGNKWVCFTKTHYHTRVSYWYNESDFELEPNQELATEEDIRIGERHFSLDKDIAKKETIKDFFERGEDD